MYVTIYKLNKICLNQIFHIYITTKKKKKKTHTQVNRTNGNYSEKSYGSKEASLDTWHLQVFYIHENEYKLKQRGAVVE